MSIWGMPSVEDQPTVTLIRWRVLRLKARKVSIDLVLGWCLEDGHARMSTPIQRHDEKGRTLTTKSGRVYILEGLSDYDDDAQYILEEHFGRSAGRAIDVSSDYFDDQLLLLQDKSSAAEKIVSLDSDVIFSQPDVRDFMNQTDKPFRPNAKLAKALKKH